MADCAEKVSSRHSAFNTIRDRNISVNATVRLPFVTDSNRAVWGRESSFSPVKIAQMRDYTNCLAARLKDFYAERGKLKTVENQPGIEATTAAIKAALGI